MKKAGITPRLIVFEDEVTPETVRRSTTTSAADRRGADDAVPRGGRLLVAAGPSRHPGRGVQADGDRRPPNVKFSNSPGKESLGGYLRVYGRDDTLVVADASESPPGEPLFVKLVDQGRVVYREPFEDQADRADRTWDRYRAGSRRRSERIHGRFEAMRPSEIAARESAVTAVK